MKKRNKFNLSNYKGFTCNMGNLIPVGIQEVLPGDTFQHSTNLMIRCAPMVAPPMHPVHVMVHHWFVPFRLVWSEWENFITGGPDGTSAPTFPTIETPSSTGYVAGSLADYLGVPIGVPNKQVSALPFRAYQLIFNEFYRDEDLVSKASLSTASGVDATTSRDLQRCAWEKDYFTSARPWEQKGNQVTLPLVGEAPVLGIGKTNGNFPQNNLVVNESDGTSSTYSKASFFGDNSGADAIFAAEGTASTSGYPDIRVDGSDFDAPSVNELRFAFAWQRVLENRARFGSRYVELLRSWGVKSSDARLQRPEYLGGGKETIQFSEVLQTAPDASSGTTQDSGVAGLYGHGIAGMRTNKYRRFFEEHGFVISLMFVRPKTIYAQGLPRLWNRRTREDFWQPELQHIGQQEVLNKEVYLAHTTPDGVFGYQDRFDELRRTESSVAGQFRPGQLFDYWTFARAFGSDPALNSTFVNCVPTEDPFQVSSEDVLLVCANHNIIARRQVAKMGNSFIK